jgi:hypothetical protein
LTRWCDEAISHQNNATISPTVINASSASAHRGFKPPKDLLEEMLAVMEGIILNHYITGPMLKTAKAQIPPRP